MIPGRVLIVDDHRRFRASARRMLASEGWTVLAEAGNGAEALEQAERVRPDLVLLDVGLPDVSGIELARTLCAGYPDLDVVLISTHDGAEYRGLARASGARGFLAKADLSSEALEGLLSR